MGLLVPEQELQRPLLSRYSAAVVLLGKTVPHKSVALGTRDSGFLGRRVLTENQFGSSEPALDYPAAPPPLLAGGGQDFFPSLPLSLHRLCMRGDRRPESRGWEIHGSC